MMGVPGIESALQWPRTVEAVGQEGLGDLGGGNVVRAVAIHDDVPVAVEPGHQLARLAFRIQQRAGNRVLQRLRRDAARIDDQGIVAAVDQRLQFGNADAGEDV